MSAKRPASAGLFVSQKLRSPAFANWRRWMTVIFEDPAPILLLNGFKKWKYGRLSFVSGGAWPDRPSLFGRSASPLFNFSKLVRGLDMKILSVFLYKIIQTLT